VAKKLWWESLLELAAGGILGYGLGQIPNEAYASCSPEQRMRWDQTRILHHGELGLMAIAGGAAAKSPFTLGIGVGLAMSDSRDAEEWFRRSE